MKAILLGIMGLLCTTPGFLLAQSVAVNTDGASSHPSAILDVQSTDRGMLIPRMTSHQRTMIASPATGLLVFDEETGSFWFYKGSTWEELIAGTRDHICDGDGDTRVMTEMLPGENQIRFEVGGQQAMMIDSAARIGIGTLTPSATLSVHGAMLLSGTTGGTPVSGAGTRLMWVPEKHALRAGSVTGMQWDDNYIGNSSAVTGGIDNTASGEAAFAAGGRNNAVPGINAAVIGGDGNSASSVNAFVGGGYENTASGARATVSGGQGNIASGGHAAVMGGAENVASGSNAFVAGGIDNVASAPWTFVGGGHSNTASNTTSATIGGQVNTASGQQSFIGGGTGNSTSGSHATVIGGSGNIASQFHAFVGGGFENVASGSAASVAGGRYNESSGANAAVIGGYQNAASASSAFIGGGIENRAMGIGAGSVGGERNVANSYASISLGGVDNTVTGNAACIAGGNDNTTTAGSSFIGGGALNTASGIASFIGGGVGIYAKSFAEAVFGSYNTDYTPASTISIVSTDRLFVIGNGVNETNRANALTMLKSGNLGIGTDVPMARFHIHGGGVLMSGNIGNTPVSGAGTRLMWVPEKQALRAGSVTGTQWDDNHIGNSSAVTGGIDNIASAEAAFSAGGRNNQVSGINAAVIGGDGNIASSVNAFVGGGYENIASGARSFVAGGRNNVASGSEAVVTGGDGNTASALFSCVAGGIGNTATDLLAFVGGGSNNSASGTNAFVGGGSHNSASGTNALIAGGVYNTATEYSSSVLAGVRNSAMSYASISLGGVDNTVSGNGACIAGGNDNTTNAGSSFIGGGAHNTASGIVSFVGGGVGLLARSYAETAIGSYNTDYTPASSIAFNSDDRVFVVGVGSSSSNRQNAMIIKKNGRTGLGREPLTHRLEVNGEASKSTAGDWLANSDARLKKNIRPLDTHDILDQLLKLQGVTYEWHDTVTAYTRPEGTHFGFTAQNVREVFPTLVTEDHLGYLQTSYGTYDAMLVEAIRSLHQELVVQRETNQYLLSEIGTLKAMVQSKTTGPVDD